MKFVVEIQGRESIVDIQMRDGRPTFSIDGQPVEADAAEIEPGVYSIVRGGRSFEAKIQESGGQLEVHIAGQAYPWLVTVRDPRWPRRSSSVSAAEGRQEIAAPMPGKVVRVLVEEQQAVTAGQGLVVVEAMKMQNEIKSPKAGLVTRVSVRPGAAVHAGETLVVVE